MKMNITHQIKKILVGCMVATMLLPVSCVKDLLDRQPTTELGAAAFWKTEADALYALNGLYSAVRPCFNRDYMLDAHGEFLRVHSMGGLASNLNGGDAYRTGIYTPSGYAGNSSNMYRYLYGAIDRANYVIDNVRNMLPEAKNDEVRARLETIIGEACLLRGMCYFRLISMWGDVPGIWKTVYDNSEVASISRTPIGVVKDSIYKDFTYAFNKLPVKTSDAGRTAKPAALAFRGKLQLYWACWNNFGWPELKDFTPSVAEAQQAYAAAAADFKGVIDDYGLALFRNGEPGECDELGKAEKLPNYYHLFLPTANGDSEFVFAFTQGGVGTGQSEELMRFLGGRTVEQAQSYVWPFFEIADRYQSTVTGDFCPPIVTKNRNTDADYFTAKNSSLNPQSYANRDYRMKSSIMWDYETCIELQARAVVGWSPFIYGTWNLPITSANYTGYPGLTADHVGQNTYNSDTNKSGYMFRKFIRNYPGQLRSEGDYNWPVIRLADVYLMYAEAMNEANNGPDSKAIELINKVRYRGNLPPLAADKTATKEEFFKAVEQERVVELLAEGHRGFDLRRWRAIERAWCPPNDPNGVQRKDTWGTQQFRFFQRLAEHQYQQCYIFRIPTVERDKNPNLTQNTPWL